MLQQQVFIINSVLMILDALCIIASGYSAYFAAHFLSDGRWSMSNESFVLSVLFVMFLNNYIMGQFRLYEDRRPSSPWVILRAVFKAILCDFAVLSALMFILKQTTFSRKFLVLFAFFSLILIIIERLSTQFYINRLYKRAFSIRKILLIGGINRCELVSKALANQLSWGHEIIGRLSLDIQDTANGAIGSIQDLPALLRNVEIDEVVFALNGHRGIDLAPYIHICKAMGVPVRILPSLWEPLDGITISVEKCQNIPFITIPVDQINATGLVYKRMLDVIGGAVGTFIFLIIFPLVYIALKLDSSGPTLFTQVRVGQHGRLFKLYKFRSMCDGAESMKAELVSGNEMEGFMFKMNNDPRITPVGHFLRKTSIDEIPQFWNVLKGEMSLVGTRPPTPDEVKSYQMEHLKRIALKPGITGLWQISGRNQIKDFEEVVRLDCKYMENWRFYHDIKIILKTVWVVLQRKGAI